MEKDTNLIEGTDITIDDIISEIDVNVQQINTLNNIMGKGEVLFVLLCAIDQMKSQDLEVIPVRVLENLIDELIEKDSNVDLLKSVINSYDKALTTQDK